MKIIGFCGRAGSDTTTAAGLTATALIDLGYTVGVDALATPIKNAARRDLGWDGGKNPLIRQYMQRFGSVHRLRDEDTFIEALRMRWHPAGEVPNYLLVTDVRYPNEADWIVRLEGLLVLMTQRASDLGDNSAHPSEIMAVDMEAGRTDYMLYVLQNGESLEDLKVVIRGLLRDGLHLLKGPDDDHA